MPECSAEDPRYLRDGKKREMGKKDVMLLMLPHEILITNEVMKLRFTGPYDGEQRWEEMQYTK